MTLRKFFRSKKRLATFIALFLALIFYLRGSPPSQIPTETIETVKVIRVIDGDTIEIEGGAKVRYIGIDTPEISTPVDCFGREAQEKNKELVEGKQVRLEKDISETDRYGRLLRYVYLGDLFVNRELVALGFAQVSTYPPDVEFQQEFLSAQQSAREANLGLWSSCSP